MLLDFDFTERQFEIKFFGYMDILAKIGGINGFVMPIVAYCAPILCMLYLYELSHIIIDKHILEFSNEIEALADEYQLALKVFLEPESKVFSSVQKSRIKKLIMSRKLY